MRRDQIRHTRRLHVQTLVILRILQWKQFHPTQTITDTIKPEIIQTVDFPLKVIQSQSLVGSMFIRYTSGIFIGANM